MRSSCSFESGALPLEGGVAVAFAKEIADADNPEERRKKLKRKWQKNKILFEGGKLFCS